MGYTDRFIEVNCLVYSERIADLFDQYPADSDLIPCVKYINPMRIESYEESIPTSDFREDNKIWTKVTMYSAENFIVNMPIKDFIKLLNVKA